jgi:subtilisin family serine protease
MSARPPVLSALLATAAAAFCAVPAAARAADPLRLQQWGLDAVRADAAVSTSDGRGVLVGLLDSGVDSSHPDLAGSIVDGPDLVDGDAHPDDGAGHGTHVAGIIVAHAGNGAGGQGVAPGARVLNIRVLGDDLTGKTTDAAKGVDEAVSAGAMVLNLSLSPGPDSSTEIPATDPLVQALDRASASGVTIVASAGNDARPLCAQPVVVPQLICVGSVNEQLERSDFSNYGLRVDLVAPGGGRGGAPIFSTLPRNAYGGYEGTSQAAPFVSAAAAELAALGLSRQQIVDRILATARDLGAPGTDNTFGHGLLDVGAAVTGLPADVQGVAAPETSARAAASGRAPGITATRHMKVGTFLRRGVRVQCRLPNGGRCTVTLTYRGRTLGRGSSPVAPAASARIVVRPVRGARRLLLQARPTVRATFVARSAGAPSTDRGIKLRR